MNRPCSTVDTQATHKFDTDKSRAYLSGYDEHLARFAHRPFTLLEVGVHRGGSLLLWATAFPQAQVVGLDLSPPQIEHERIFLYAGSQDDGQLIQRITRENTEDGFDVIIDDASHQGKLSATTFQHCFNSCLRPAGLYVIEDWGTGFWKGDWDGNHYAGAQSWVIDSEGARMKSHDYGLVGFLKSLVDQVAIPDIRHDSFGIPEFEPVFPIAKICLCPGQAFIWKASDE